MTKAQKTTPQDRALTLLDKVTPCNDGCYIVDASDGWFYTVSPKTAAAPASCNCPAHQFNPSKRCKHRWAVRLFIKRGAK